MKKNNHFKATRGDLYSHSKGTYTNLMIVRTYYTIFFEDKYMLRNCASVHIYKTTYILYSTLMQTQRTTPHMYVSTTMSPWDWVFPGMKTSFRKTHHEDGSTDNALCKLDLGMWTCSQKRFRDTSNVQLGLQFAEVESERLGEKEAQNDWLEALLIHRDYVDKWKGWVWYVCRVQENIPNCGSTAGISFEKDPNMAMA